MRKPRSIAALAMVGLGLFGAIGLNVLPQTPAEAVQIVGAPPEEKCPQVPGAPKDFCPPPPPPGGECPTTSTEKCPDEEPECDGRRCPPPSECDIRECPPPAECEHTCETTTTTIGKKVPPGVSWNPNYTG
jgi:hypothetical protein